MQWKHHSLDRALLSRDAWAARDVSWARWVHRLARYNLAVRALVVVSWLGDGVLWYVLIGALALLGSTDERDVAMQMMLAGALNLPLYFWLKRSIGRPRPYVQCPGIEACARALDKFSFPSGHTLHAFTFLVILAWYFPAWGLAVLPLVVLIAISRVALGLHYPSDVAAGAALGAAVAAGVLALY
jgi:undecaprenyl-diphosphatase